MNGALSILGALGGVAAFIAGVWAIVRGMLRVSDTTEANTRAINTLTTSVDRLDGKLDDHEGRLLVIEDRGKRETRPR